MPFGQFRTIDDVLALHPLILRNQVFVPQVRVAAPSEMLDDFQFALSRRPPVVSEVFNTENFIYPILRWAWKRHPRLQIWPQKTITASEQLRGEPDYLVSVWPTGVTDRLLTLPLMAVVEAKRQDFDEGWGQCLAAMLACQTINASTATHVFGVVSTGPFWEFGVLAGVTYTRDPFGRSLNEADAVFGAVDFLFAECERQLPATPTGAS